MRKKTASPRDRFDAGIAVGFLSAAGRKIVNNPVITGGGTALAVTMFYFAANALWYQPHAHRNMLFETRSHDYRAPANPDDEAKRQTEKNTATRIILERSGDLPDPAPVGDPVTRTVQQVLAGLDLYDGEVDGLQGPQTSKAIVTYRKIMKLGESDEIDAVLLENLGAGKKFAQPVESGSDEILTSSIPVPTPRSTVVRQQTPSATFRASTRAPEPLSDVDHGLAVKIQAGLREFGNDSIVLDGQIGSQTTHAIREFQTLFGLPVTGKIDDTLITKMEEIGLINL